MLIGVATGNHAFDAASRALRALGYEVAYEDRSRGTINTTRVATGSTAYATSRTTAIAVMLSRQVTVRVAQTSNGTSRVTVLPIFMEGDRAVTDDRQRRSICSAVHSEMKAILASEAPPVPEPDTTRI